MPWNGPAWISPGRWRASSYWMTCERYLARWRSASAIDAWVGSFSRSFSTWSRTALGVGRVKSGFGMRPGRNEDVFDCIRVHGEYLPLADGGGRPAQPRREGEPAAPRGIPRD